MSLKRKLSGELSLDGGFYNKHRADNFNKDLSWKRITLLLSYGQQRLKRQTKTIDTILHDNTPNIGNIHLEEEKKRQEGNLLNYFGYLGKKDSSTQRKKVQPSDAGNGTRAADKCIGCNTCLCWVDYSCAHCENTLCSGCVRACGSCEQLYCGLCTRTSYKSTGTEVMCWSCNHA